MIILAPGGPTQGLLSGDFGSPFAGTFVSAQQATPQAVAKQRLTISGNQIVDTMLAFCKRSTRACTLVPIGRYPAPERGLLHCAEASGAKEVDIESKTGPADLSSCQPCNYIGRLVSLCGGLLCQDRTFL